MLTTDPPEHDRLRAPAASILGPAATVAAGAPVRHEIDHLLQQLGDRGEVDAIADIGEPFAIAVLGTVLGIPVDERAGFGQLARGASVNLDPLASPEVTRAASRATTELTSYLTHHARRVRANGDRDHDHGLTEFVGDDRLSLEEGVAVLSLCVVGGFEPLVNLVGNALLLLLSPRGEMPEPACGWESHARDIVEEVLRLESPIPFTARVTTGPVALGSVGLPSGALVLAVLAAANRDPAAFADPDQFRLTRRPNPQLAFGAGPHFCLAAPLVRLAGTALIQQILGRFPELAAVPSPAPPSWRPSLVPRGLIRYRVWLGPYVAP